MSLGICTAEKLGTGDGFDAARGLNTKTTEMTDEAEKQKYVASRWGDG